MIRLFTASLSIDLNSPKSFTKSPHVKVESERVVKFGFAKTQTVSSPPLQESGLRRIFIKTFLNDHLTVKQSSLLFSRTICSFNHSQSKVSSCRFKQFCHKCTRVLCLLHSRGLIIFLSFLSRFQASRLFSRALDKRTGGHFPNSFS